MQAVVASTDITSTVSSLHKCCKSRANYERGQYSRAGGCDCIKFMQLMHNNNQRIIIDLSVTLRVECRFKYFCFNCQIKGINQSIVQTFIPSIDGTIDFIAYAFDLFNHNQDELVMSNRLEISRS